MLREKLSVLQKTKLELVSSNVHPDNDYIDIDDLETIEAWDRYNQDLQIGAKFFPGHRLMMETYSHNTKFDCSTQQSYNYLLQTGNILLLQCVWKCHESLTGLKPPPHPFSIAEQGQGQRLTGMIDDINQRIRTLTNQCNLSHSQKQTVPIPSNIKAWITLAGHVIYETQRLCPFIDGNKRMGVLLGNYILQQKGRLPFVVSIDQPSSSEGGTSVFRSRGEVIQLLGSRIASNWREYDCMTAAMSQAMMISLGHAPFSSTSLSRPSHHSHRKTDEDGVNTSMVSNSTDVQSTERAVVGDHFLLFNCYYIYFRIDNCCYRRYHY